MMRNRKVLTGAVLHAALVSALACSSGPSEPASGTTPPPDSKPGVGGQPEKGVFESAHPSGPAAARGGTGGVSTPPGNVSNPGAAPGVPVDGNGASPVTPTPPPATPPPAVPQAEAPDVVPDDVNRLIEEADVIKRQGDRLYALSAIGGLTVVDIGDPDALELLGRFRATATPFEMYVRDQTVFVLYNGVGEYEYDEQTKQYTFYQTSHVVSLDVSDPAAIVEEQRFEVPGYIADSRLVGDALYVVAYDDSYCYRCGDQPQTHVLSLNVSNPAEIVKVDEISFAERQDGYGWGRSLSANDQRLYVGGPRYGDGVQPEGSTIQVIDITDPAGDMEKGAAIDVAGQINSRWQMDEYEGVLRVVSQPLSWAQVTVPAVETFEVVSSTEFKPLGAIDLVLPEPETLQAVRFDGPRGYAITFRQTDPLFTIDLSDPANPLQAGELLMPGWVHHMEPRGDRLIGLGYDNGNEEGNLTVSLFDVSDLSTPTMIDRVNFGGHWGDFSEDQNRIHKSFQVLDADELVLVPYAGYEYSQDECNSYGAYKSGVQLINFADDDLTLAGVAPSQGQARRAFLHKERLLTMSAERLQSFDISDRDEPMPKSKVDLAQIVNQLEVAGDSVVRIGNSFWTNEQGLELTVSNLEDLVNLEPGVAVELDDVNVRHCNGGSYLVRTLSDDERVYLQYAKQDYGSETKGQEMRVKVLDVSNPEGPEVVGDADLGFFPQGSHVYVPGLFNNGSDTLALGSAMVFTNHNIEYNDLGFIAKNESTLEVVNFADAAKPTRTSIPMPASLGSTGLLKSGDAVATSHFEAAPNNPEAVRFYLDRVDVSDPSEPAVLEPLNIPGSLLAYDHENQRALTLDYVYVNFESITPRQCYEEEFGTFVTSDPSRVDYEAAQGPCTALRFKLHLVDVSGETARLVDSYSVDKGVYISAAALGDDRVFLATATNGSYYGGGPVPPTSVTPPAIGIGGGVGHIGYGYHSVAVGAAKVLVVSGLGEDELTVAPVQLQTTNNFYGFSWLLAKGKKAVVATGWANQMSVVDATEGAEPVVADSIELAGNVSDLDLVGNTAVVALGQSGVQTLPLGE